MIIGKATGNQVTATAVYARLDKDPVRQSVEGAASAMFEAAGLKTNAEVIQLPAAKKEGV